jgi:hypothetical protein
MNTTFVLKYKIREFRSSPFWKKMAISISTPKNQTCGKVKFNGTDLFFTHTIKNELFVYLWRLFHVQVQQFPRSHLHRQQCALRNRHCKSISVSHLATTCFLFYHPVISLWTCCMFQNSNYLSFNAFLVL